MKLKKFHFLKLMVQVMVQGRTSHSLLTLIFTKDNLEFYRPVIIIEFFIYNKLHHKFTK